MTFKIGELNLTHGKYKTVEYKAWKGIKSRCYNVNCPKYKNYGARGITMCERWLNSFQNFLDDLGLKPTPKHSLERINVEYNYEPSNCKWATTMEQGRNKTTTKWVNTPWGKISLIEAAEKSGMNYYTLKSRLRSGKTDEEIFSNFNFKTGKPL